MKHIDININETGTQTFKIDDTVVTVTIKKPVLKVGDVFYSVHNNAIRLYKVISHKEAIKIKPIFEKWTWLQKDSYIYFIDHNGNVQAQTDNTLEKWFNKRTWFFKTSEEAIDRITKKLSDSIMNSERKLNHVERRYGL